MEDNNDEEDDLRMVTLPLQAHHAMEKMEEFVHKVNTFKSVVITQKPECHFHLISYHRTLLRLKHMKSYNMPNITLDRLRREGGHLAHPESFNDEIVHGSGLFWTIVYIL